ncbi:hypothetical protein [Bizionia myxarmorum]|uniref:Uncharacterized protein n=1 Tax=Bizionia myxarmorum TaxID=291186 RepID=A0A5D0RCG6_9FLAO|nr:hypothetical protein [Bizionia myxarmorum]TYB78571.1 hypothetical protein ES674_01980 [Bizionia myxarmorum]
MKTSFLLFIGLLLSNLSSAQVSIGSSVSPTNLYVSKIKEAEFDYLKTTKTYFIVPNELDFEKTKNLISDIWTFNDIEFVAQENYIEDDYVLENNTIIRIHDENYALVKRQLGKNDKTVGMWFVKKFELISYPSVKINKKGEKNLEIYEFADVFFTQSILNRFQNSPHYREKKAKEISDEPDYYNFDYGYIKNYFQTLNDKLNKKEMLNVRDGIVNTKKLKTLKEQTLFIPDWTLKSTNAFTGALSKIQEPEELFEKYEFPYEMISHQALNDKILSGEKFYYLMHSQFNEYKLLSIIDSVTGEIIYLVENKGYNIKSGDLKDINKEIE